MDRIGESVAGCRITRRVAMDPRSILYEAEQESGRVYLRVLLPELSSNQRAAARFLNSAAVLQQVNHPSLVRIQGTGTLPDGCVYTLLLRMDGQPLGEARRQELAQCAVPIVLQLASVLSEFHKRGSAYLDVQPDRILLQMQPGELRAQLLDTEAARAPGDSTPRPTLGDAEIRGLDDAILFLAPEYFSEQGGVGPPADVYALGVLAYQLLTGKSPCPGARTGEVVHAHLHAVPPTLQSIASNVPDALASLIESMLAKDTRHRPEMRHVAKVLSDQLALQTPMKTPDVTPSVPQQFGDYEVVRLIGEGGMGQVYEAFSARQQRRAAIKVIRPEFCRLSEARNSFLEEVRAANLVSHPGIITIHQIEQSPDGRLYMVMEYLDGGTLRDRIEGGALSPLRAVNLAWQTALALSASHERGVIHRDLKPENIGIVLDRTVPGGERTKVLDFGVAKLVRASSGSAQLASPTRTVSGTPLYMPPEQVQDASSVDDRADVYALGQIIREMLQGSLSVGQSKLGPACPPLLVRLLDQMQARDRTQRPSMKQVAVALEGLDAQFVNLQRDNGGSMAPPVEPLRAGRGLSLVLAGSVVTAAASVALWLWTKSVPGPDDRHGPATDMTEAGEPPPPGMASLEGGIFAMGSSTKSEDPMRTTTMVRFAIDIDEVTNSQFADWLNSLSTRGGLPVTVDQAGLVHQGKRLLADLDPQYSGIVQQQGRQFSARPGAERKPVVLVSYAAADAYCRNHQKRLPRENEWELAARGAELSRTYPWGPTAPACRGVVFGRGPDGACAAEGQGPQVVGSQAGGTRQDRTPEGVFDLGGNVAEWVASSAVAKPEIGQSALRVVRGGDWLRPAESCHVRSRIPVDGEQPRANIGFRCAVNL